MFVHNYAYVRRKDSIQFAAVKDYSDRSCCKIKFICSKNCGWHITASISRNVKTLERCEIKTHELQHDPTCMGSDVKPDLIWLLQFQPLMSYVIIKMAPKKLIEKTSMIGIIVNKDMVHRMNVNLSNKSIIECNES